jgi:hypothetical protein
MLKPFLCEKRHRTEIISDTKYKHSIMFQIFITVCFELFLKHQEESIQYAMLFLWILMFFNVQAVLGFCCCVFFVGTFMPGILN